jgi:putative inorganic carbon (hco3(-)) transporter
MDKVIRQRFQLPSSLERPSEAWLFLILACSIASVLVSIAISQILLAVALILWIGISKWSDKKALLRLPFIPPLLGFIIWTILSALVSSNPVPNFIAAKKFFLFLPLFLVPAIVQGENKTSWIYRAIFAVSSLSAIVGIFQYFANTERDLLHRISGFMSHWMTYAGLLMLVLVLLISYALNVRWRDHKWIIPLGCLICIPLVLSQTRSALMGAIAGAIVVILLKQPRAIFGLFAIILIAYFVSPQKIKERLQSSWNLQDINTNNRIEIWGTSWRLIKDNPWFGVGLKSVNSESLKYRRNREFPNWAYQHAHNNFLQIAAERGIPGLIFWIWLMIRFGWDSMKGYRISKNSLSDSKEALTASVASLGALTALVIAGLTEYNFGDSEVLTLFLFITSATYAFIPELQIKANSHEASIE